MTSFRTLILAACAMFALAAPAYAQREDLPLDSRIKLLNYDENDVYRITTRYGYQTNVVFAEGEQVETISLGDRSLWQIIPANNRLFIRPSDVDVSTNMTVITNKRAYNFDLKEVGEKKGEAVYVVRFRYPDDKPRAAHAAPAYEAPIAAPVIVPVKPVVLSSVPHDDTGAGIDSRSFASPAPANANFNYSYTGSDTLSPYQVFDDGQSTFISWRDMTRPMPKIFLIGENRREFPSSYYLQDGYLKLDSIAAEWVLKYNNETLRLYNEAYVPNAARSGR